MCQDAGQVGFMGRVGLIGLIGETSITPKLKQNGSSRWIIRDRLGTAHECNDVGGSGCREGSGW